MFILSVRACAVVEVFLGGVFGLAQALAGGGDLRFQGFRS